MPGTYSQILLHVVFSTKQRRPWLTPEVTTRLYPYLGGVVRGNKGTLLAVGGVDDHVHLYLRWCTDEALSDLMRVLKSDSSKWIHDKFPKLSRFAWQTGYAAFSVSKSQEGAVKKYIAGQAAHHRRVDFKSELLKLLRAHEIEFDERFVFE
jgi:REP element-mobilizing transposase RayT